MTVPTDPGVPTVLLHPSLGRGRADVDDLARALAEEGLRIVAVDPPSAVRRDPATVTLSDLAADLAALLGQTGPAHVVGHAFGNRVVRCLATEHPQLVRSVVLLGAGGRFPPDPDAAAQLARCFTETDPEAHLDAVAAAFFAPGNDPRPWRDGWDAACAAEQHAASERTPVDAWWDGGTAPMLVVQGLQDRIAPPANGRLLVAERPATRLVEVDGAGHALLPEQPAVVAAAVVEHLRGLGELGG